MKFVQQRAVAFTLILVAQQAQALTAFGELGRYGDESNGSPSNSPEDDYQERQIQQLQIAVQVPPHVAQGGPGNAPPPGNVWIQVPTGGGYPQQPGGYPQQPSGYPQQVGGYPQQPGGYPQRPGGYPQQPGGYPQQPGGYPQQSGTYPQQPAGGYPQQPSGGYPQQPAGGYPQQPSGGNPQQPAGGYPQQPSGGSSQTPSSGFPTGDYNPPKPVGGNPQQPSGWYPQQPSGGYPQRPSGGNPQQPSGEFPQQPSGGYPQQPVGGQSTPAPFPAPVPVPSNELNPGQETGSNAEAAFAELRRFCLSPRGQFPIDKSCSKFVNCWDDVAIESDCPGGLVFNPAGFCDYPYNVDCGNRLTDKPPPVSDKGLCPSPYGAYRSADSCNTFFVCVSGTPVKFDCPEGLNYNDELGVCDYPYNVDCHGTPTGLPAESQVTTATPSPTTDLNPSNYSNIYSGQYQPWLKKIPASFIQTRYKRLVKKS